jgi:hypothetical protein
MLNGEQVTHLIKGAGGISAILLTDMVPTADMTEIVKLVIQLIVGVGTLWHMWKSRSNKSQ